MERTGHGSLDGVKGYKHTSKAQKEAFLTVRQRVKRTLTVLFLSPVTLLAHPLFQVALR